MAYIVGLVPNSFFGNPWYTRLIFFVDDGWHCNFSKFLQHERTVPNILNTSERAMNYILRGRCLQTRYLTMLPIMARCPPSYQTSAKPYCVSTRTPPVPNIQSPGAINITIHFCLILCWSISITPGISNHYSVIRSPSHLPQPTLRSAPVDLRGSFRETARDIYCKCNVRSSLSTQVAYTPSSALYGSPWLLLCAFLLVTAASNRLSMYQPLESMLVLLFVSKKFKDLSTVDSLM